MYIWIDSEVIRFLSVILLGTLYADSQLVSTGMWALFKLQKATVLKVFCPYIAFIYGPQSVTVWLGINIG